MYKAGHIEVKYLDMIYKTDYLDWYKQAVHDGKCATPTWVININDALNSDIEGNEKFYPVYATTIAFTSYFLSSSSKSMQSDENVTLKPTLVVIPHGSCLAVVSEYQKNQTPVPISIKKFVNCDSVLMPHSNYEFKDVVINHVELINGDEVAIIFTGYSIDIEEKIWRNDGTYAGNVKKSLNYKPLSAGGLAAEGMSALRGMIP